MKYLDKNELIDISSIINLDYKLFAHMKKDEKGIKYYENLEDHIKLSNKYFFKICEKRNLENVFKKFENFYLKDISENAKRLFRKLLINVVNFHDIGKINPKFQSEKMGNKLENHSEFSGIGSNHSIISSIIYIDYFWNEVNLLEKKEDKKKLKEFLFLNSYLLSKHHGDLDSYEYFVNSINVGQANEVIKILTNYKWSYKKNFELKLNKVINRSNKILKDLKKLTNEEAMYLYTYERLVFSLILASDFYSTSEFMNEISMDNFGDINDISEFYDVYKETDIYKSIQEYKKSKYNKENHILNYEDINILRNEIFLDAEDIMKNNIDGEIFYLEAPTGAGKSNIATNLSFKLINENNLKKIFWVYPFNTLVEQNKENLKKIYKNKEDVLRKIATINSLTPIKVDKKENEKEKELDDEFTDEEKYRKYAYALLNRQFLNYPMILITHVGMFDSMFGRSKENIFSFHQLANSVLVFDEIQSYKLEIWTEIISFLKVFSKLLNIKVIIMSATLPNLEILTNIKGSTVNLIENRDKYFNNSLFKDRVKVDYSLMNENLNELIEHIIKNSNNKKKILVEFITKKTANLAYDKLIESKLKCDVLLLTGDDNQIDRNNILKMTKSNTNSKNGVILISTQVIEAGVDIDMDIGYKDKSKLDSEEQFMGRINRSCKGNGIVYFFNIDNEKNIYTNDIRVEHEYTIKSEWVRDVLISKEFSSYYSTIMEKLVENYNESTDIKYSIEEFFRGEVAVLDFYKVSKKMKLIDDNKRTVSIFLARKIKDEFGNVINGMDVWKSYKNLLNDKKLKYAEREIKLSKVRAEMNNFIYELERNPDVSVYDNIGELFYIENGEKYFKNGKIDKEKLITGIGDYI